MAMTTNNSISVNARRLITAKETEYLYFVKYNDATEKKLAKNRLYSSLRACGT
jgi:hypothetical protein